MRKLIFYLSFIFLSNALWAEETDSIIAIQENDSIVEEFKNIEFSDTVSFKNSEFNRRKQRGYRKFIV